MPYNDLMVGRRKRSFRKFRLTRRTLVLAALALALLMGPLVWLALRSASGSPDITARVLFSETAGCAHAERLLVAGVMQNRIHSPPFGNAATLRAVVTQPGAFSCINDTANANWRKSAHPERMTSAERTAWQDCLDTLRQDIPPAVGPSGRPLVYYHDKSITKPRSWDNAKWTAVREVTTAHFVFYSIVRTSPVRDWLTPRS